ncbi:NAD(P)-dependent dehydrogenase (short-subunit alcohol dehydrogenase family) [Evansella vedderi]|uniref:NAD(P)-dependent dehydrogenase (Short-subunit alcohol dehydrogenase family) n=1 Tax=Evansella vedderi TaxID=38282 RepID=A0ABT9ZY56_9BACI|nr:SDR family oxidoreductase [Evansella vedderi]MDQ0256172.1 NAD(P)-dependent dehydrogenase (short-subunit alcohol dehydrogenase family) [Evansella vedderi]
MNNWNNKIVLITGAANGIGKAIAASYAKRGANVYIVDVDRKNGDKLTEKLERGGYKATFIPGDVSREKDVLQALEKVKGETNKLHVIINNAGISTFPPLEELEFSQWERILHTNLSSAYMFSKYGSKLMEEGGAIVNISSTRAIMSEPNSEAYAASKGGIVALTHALAASLAPKKIRVNAISPGWIETGNYDELRHVDHEQHLSGRVGKPEDIVRACFFLSDPENDFITGENLVVDGGMTRKMIYHH